MTPGPARCQLYLAAPAHLPADFATTLAGVLGTAEIACLRLPAKPGIADLVRLAQSLGTAVVIAGNPALADELGADGVHIAGLEAYGAARGRLGPDAIIGVHCDRSRHDAMEAGEAGADYVSFAADLGASNLQSFTRIVLPLSLPGTVTAATFVFVLAIGDFLTPQMVGGLSGFTFGRIIYSQFGTAFNWPFGSALSVILAAVVILAIVAGARLGGRQRGAVS